jgi:hypothetical protein
VQGELRAEDRRWHEVRKKTGIKIDYHMNHNVKLHRCASTMSSVERVDADSAKSSYLKDEFRVKHVRGTGVTYFGWDERMVTRLYS